MDCWCKITSSARAPQKQTPACRYTHRYDYDAITTTSRTGIKKYNVNKTSIDERLLGPYSLSVPLLGRSPLLALALVLATFALALGLGATTALRLLIFVGAFVRRL